MLPTMRRRESRGRLLPRPPSGEGWPRPRRALDEEPRDCRRRSSGSSVSSGRPHSRRERQRRGGTWGASWRGRKEGEKGKEEKEKERRKRKVSEGPEGKEEKETGRRSQEPKRKHQLDVFKQRFKSKAKPGEENLGGSFRKDRLGSITSSSSKAEKEGSKVFEEVKEEEELRKQQHRLQFQHCQRGPPVSGTPKGEGHRDENAGGFDSTVYRGDAGKSSHCIRSGLECQGGLSSSCRHPLFPHSPPAQDDRRNRERVIDIVDDGGYGIARPSGRVSGHRHSEAESSGVDLPGHRFQGGSTLGVVSSRIGCYGLLDREEGGPSGEQRGSQVEISEFQRRRRLLERRVERRQGLGKEGRWKVPPESWEEMARNLIEKGVCRVIGGRDVFRVQGKKLLNGMFGVSKQEYVGSTEVHRLIMNLIPLNKIVRGVDGDIATLPAWASMTPLFLDDDQQLLVSSEDVRCFFYIFRTPPEWRKFMAFNRPLPKSLWPQDGEDSEYFLCADVLPMGFKNSVSIAQNIHRNIASWAGVRGGVLDDPPVELRKDRAFPQGSTLYRLYLDNFDLLEKVDTRTANLVSGKPSVETLSMRAEYEEWGIPRHPKKSVVRKSVAEVQGAIVDGTKGVAFPKTEKLLRYMMLGLRFFYSASSTQKEAQVVGGGLVYVAMFRRPLLGGLNAIWEFISSFEGYPPVCRLPIPFVVKLEVVRFLSLFPLAMMNFRPNFDGNVTASDASSSGGGITVSRSLTAFGEEASQGLLRGDVPGTECASQILTIGLFDGIAALRVAVDSLGVMSAGHVSVECSSSARRIVESYFPEVITVTDVADVSEEMVKGWACRFTQVALVLIGAGPPCQGVSGLNSERKGATRDRRSSLYFHLPRVRKLLVRHFPWAQVHSLMESVASMDACDRAIMSESEGSLPWRIDSAGVSLARRPRLYWISWEVSEDEGVDITPPLSKSTWEDFGSIDLIGTVSQKRFLSPGWQKVSTEPFPTFTTSRPREYRGPRPAGLDKCSPEEVSRWEEDLHRFPPYQYRSCFCLTDGKGHIRYPNVSERELIMGFPLGYTSRCFPKSENNKVKITDERLTLLGNSWNVTVVVWLLGQLFGSLGFCNTPSPSRCVELTSPGGDGKMQSLLLRPPLAPIHPVRSSSSASELRLVKKLVGLVSIKGEDILLSGASDHQRASIPSKLWRWRTVCGWVWKGAKEHINVLELRAVLATIKWRVEKRHNFNLKFVHLVGWTAWWYFTLFQEAVQVLRKCAELSFEPMPIFLRPIIPGCGLMFTPL